LVASEQLDCSEVFYPLHVRVCQQCFLIQLPEIVAPQEIFGQGDYAYFSSYSQSWLDHARRYARETAEQLHLDKQSRVVEVASNDGYLLQYFRELGIPVLGIEPASNCAAAARENGIDTIVQFFGAEVADQVADQYGKADLLIGNNVLAHVPDINGFVQGLKRLLSPKGVITMEFPHLVNLVAQVQYDTIYHEHYSYLSLLAVETIFQHHGLRLFDVRELPTHGGSLRIYATHAEREQPAPSNSLLQLRDREDQLGMKRLEYYEGFGERVARSKRGLLRFLIELREQGKKVAGYGAPGKGNTLLNYCGIRTDLLEYTVDRNPHKHGHYTAGTHVPICDPSRIFETRPDYVLILPWNLKDEIVSQMRMIEDWGGQFVIPIPEVEVIRP
jgi:SAM-dependent methyltransferase